MTSSAVSADSRLQLELSDGTPSDFARSIRSACASSSADLILTAGFPCQDLSPAGKRQGLNGSKSSLAFHLIGLLSRTHIIDGEHGCPNCGAPFIDSDTPVCRFECEPQTLEQSIVAPVHGWLPTPTASSYGSCRGGGAGRVGKWRPSLHSLGIQHPEDWERMMGFPIGWTDAAQSEMLSTPTPSNSFSEAYSTSLKTLWPKGKKSSGRQNQ